MHDTIKLRLTGGNKAGWRINNPGVGSSMLAWVQLDILQTYIDDAYDFTVTYGDTPIKRGMIYQVERFGRWVTVVPALTTKAHSLSMCWAGLESVCPMFALYLRTHKLVWLRVEANHA